MAESTGKFIATGEFDELPNRAGELQANEAALDAPAPAPEKQDQAEVERDTAETTDAGPDVETSAERKVRKARAQAGEPHLNLKLPPADMRRAEYPGAGIDFVGRPVFLPVLSV